MLLQQQRLTPSFAGARCPHLFWHTTIFVPKDSPLYCKICFNLSPHCVLFFAFIYVPRYIILLLLWQIELFCQRPQLSFLTSLLLFLDTLFSRHSIRIVCTPKHIWNIQTTINKHFLSWVLWPVAICMYSYLFWDIWCEKPIFCKLKVGSSQMPCTGC